METAAERRMTEASNCLFKVDGALLTLQTAEVVRGRLRELIEVTMGNRGATSRT